MVNATLTIRTDGTIQAMYTEAIELSALGLMDVRRATLIEFDNRLQAWRVLDPIGDCLYCSPSRDTCLAWERKHLNWVLDNS
jgi:hypothetical protein